MYPRCLEWIIQFVAYIVLQWQCPIDCRPIVGGRIVPKMEISRYPYIVSLQDRISLENGSVIFKHFCGGSLISTSWILTAGHCVYYKKEGDIVAAIGYEDLTANDIDHREVDDIKFTNFVPSSLRNDIALVKLKYPVVQNEQMSLGLLLGLGMEENSEEPCRIVGYGADRYGGMVQDKLNEGEVEMISRENCTRILGKIMAPQEGDRSVCGLGDSQDSCQGDSGGPLLCPVSDNYYIFGIVSHGLTCGQPGVPSIYTLTMPYKQWIEGVINE